MTSDTAALSESQEVNGGELATYSQSESSLSGSGLHTAAAAAAAANGPRRVPGCVKLIISLSIRYDTVD